MKRIDRETVQRILDAADIVDVVSDFVTLKRRGANFIGLCPFHNERTPSFSVSKSKGICKCFSCGKGGSPVNFLMELEQWSYNEALRYLAKKYNIEIKEHEMSDAERQAETQRESMFAVNDFALGHFERNLTETDDGRMIGLSYFHERGINDQMIKRFHLGYAIDKSDDLYNAAIKAGYSEQYLVDTGLCIRNDRGRVYDRFKGRVIYPVHSLSGKVVAFGGRTLRKDKEVAKYVNSPESVIYSKSRELYGLYQAKQAIVKQDKCILVEGYMDVISMHQAGVENVVASSGTSLTDSQVRLIHRFTENVTIIYDSDAAGIKASLRGIDMLLAEGLNIKVLLLPDGDDPDSFSQSHTSAEVFDYIKENETDFIRFKTRILLKDAGDDPIARSRVVADIVKSISMIPVEMVREQYIKDCSRMLDVDERALKAQLHRDTTKRTEELINRRKQEAAQRGATPAGTADPVSGTPTPDSPQSHAQTTPPVAAGAETTVSQPLQQVLQSNKYDMYERELLRYIVKYGMITMAVEVDDNGSTEQIKIIDLVMQELEIDGITFTNSVYARTFDKAVEVSRATWDTDYAAHRAMVDRRRKEAMDRGLEEIRQAGADVNDIARREKALNESVEKLVNDLDDEFAIKYISGVLINTPDDEVRRITTDLLSERHQLSAIHTKTAHIPTERERLPDLVPRAVYALKYEILRNTTLRLMAEIKDAATAGDANRIVELMQQVQRNNEIKAALAQMLGERIVTP